MDKAEKIKFVDDDVEIIEVNKDGKPTNEMEVRHAICWLPLSKYFFTLYAAFLLF